MRWALLGLLAMLLVAPATAAAQPLEPPVIREAFTPLPCPRHPQTTLALEGCAEQAILSTDRMIDAKVKTIFGLLRTSAARQALVTGERAWLRYRDASCTAEASVYTGGTAQPVLYANCLDARNRTHLRDLSALKSAVSRP